MQNEKIGIILLNMGGPSNLQEVRPFLYNIFSDREIIRLGPPFLQKPLAWMIARKRAPKSMATYEKIGGGSPITRITRKQAEALEKALCEHGDFTVTMAMRYWQPTSREALQIMREKGICKIVALSLYPHYSCATSGSSFKELKRNNNKNNCFELTEITAWPDHPGYISCLADRIKRGVLLFAPSDAEIVYSAHNLPTSFVEEGDPYVTHLKKTIEAIEKITAKQGRLCFQSKSGPVDWLSPSTPEMLERIGREGKKNILMVPISFVSDHVETLYEIKMEYRDLAAELGMRLEMTEALNCDPHFIDALKDLVLQAISVSS
ncbi:MAG: ferrochelatase [Desulfobacterales bacterium]|nr:MAG: ferrochelatase [Desulfobacterales bacterium]